MAALYKRVTYVDCASGSLLLNADGSISPRLLTDGVHPSPSGYEAVLNQCYIPAIDQLLAAAGGGGTITKSAATS